MAKVNGGRVKRWDWVIQLVRFHGYTRGAEVGVHTGMMTSSVLRACPDLHLYAVDNWWAVPAKPTNPKELKKWVDIGLAGRNPNRDRNKFTLRTSAFVDRLTVLYGDSVEMAKEVEDGSLDFVFIDADHRHDSVVADLKAWVPKVKEDGIISGHDYNHPRFPGVTSAVIECFGDSHEEAHYDYIWSAKREDFLL